MDTTEPQRKGLPAWFYYGLLLLAASAFVLHDNPADRDLWHRLALGRFFFTHHSLPSHDVFSYLSESKPLRDHEWGCGLLFYALYHYIGGWTLVALKYAVFIGTLFLIDKTARVYERRRDFIALSWMLLVALALAPSFVSTVRCLVFTNLFLALWLYWLVRQRAGHHVPAWYFLVTAALWANLHGGFVSGIGLIALYALGERLNHRPSGDYFRLAGLTTLATLCNPYTYHLWISTAQAVIAPRARIYEWAAPPVWDLTYLGFKLLVVATVAVFVMLAFKRRVLWDWVGILAVGITLVLAMRHVRHLALFSIVTGVFTYRGIVELRPGHSGERSPLAAKLIDCLRIAYVAALVILSVFLLRSGDGFQLEVTEPDYPVRAAEFMDRTVHRDTYTALLVPFNWGSYAMWKLFPQYTVSLDGRYELVYSQKTYRAVTDFFFDGPDYARILRVRRPGAILLPRNAALEKKLSGELGYQRIYQDDTAAVYVPAH